MFGHSARFANPQRWFGSDVAFDRGQRRRRSARPSSGAVAGTRLVLESDWAVGCAHSTSPALGGSSCLNLVVTDGLSEYVARVYRPSVTAERLAVLHRVRSHLRLYGVPTVEPIPTRAGEPSAAFEDRLVELESFVASTHPMDDIARVRKALPLLGKIHFGALRARYARRRVRPHLRQLSAH